MTTTATPRSTRAATHSTIPRATRPKTPAIPALMPIPEWGIKTFWPIMALNTDAKLQALESLQDKAFTTDRLKPGAYVTQVALVQATSHLLSKCTADFETCRDRGHLLYAWRGSKALVQPLPASLKGGAA